MTTLASHDVSASFINDIEMNLQIVFSKQERKVLELMLRDGHVSRMTAMHYGIANLTARIAELRQKLILDNYDIPVAIKEDASGREYGSWYLVDTTFESKDHFLRYDPTVVTLPIAA